MPLPLRKTRQMARRLPRNRRPRNCSEIASADAEKIASDAAKVAVEGAKAAIQGASRPVPKLLRLWIGVVLAAFGFVLGILTVLSTASGISTTLIGLLAALFGGSLLTWFQPCSCRKTSCPPWHPEFLG